MKKITKILQYLVLCGILCVASPKQGYCFLSELLPPLPFDIVIDPGDNSVKIVAHGKTIFRKQLTIKTAKNSSKLESVKGGNLGPFAGNVGKYKEGGKTPAKEQLKAVPELDLKKGDVRETKYFDAYRKLFLQAPNGQQARIDYRKKAIEFKQDMIIDAYVAGRMTEDYLILVERTIKRLDECQQGKKSGDNCTFFGLKWADIKSSKEIPEDENNPGQMGEARNAYIVITMYDRLMRIVEDLAATEAMFQAARSLDLAKPTEGSDASQYINMKFHFEHNQVHETLHASNAVVPLKSVSIAKILNKLQRIDEWQQGALAMHNLKVKLPEYKVMYRKYLKAKQVHERALKALGDSDECAKTFLTTYGDGLTEGWGESNPINDYANRSGISRALIEDYETAVETTIIETDEELCPGYYKKCPAGYVNGEACKAKVVNEETGEETETVVGGYHTCIMDTVENDSDMVMEEVENEENLTEDSLGEVEDSINESELNKDTRIKAERAWRVGRDKIMELTESHQLEFLPWNDQKNLQETYIRHKYRNMQLIVLSIDDAFNTFKIAKNFVEDEANAKKIEDDLAKNEEYKKVKEFITAVTSCKTAKEAEADAKAEWCTNLCGSCSVTGDNATGKVVGTKDVLQWHDVYDDDGNKIGREQRCDGVETHTWDQTIRMTPTCDFKKTPKEMESLTSDGKCPGTWDLTADFLVKNYFKAVLGDCEEDTTKAAENMLKKADGRFVAQNALKNVIDLRQAQEAEMQKFVKDYENGLYKEGTGKRPLLAKLKKDLGEVNKNINKETKRKNATSQEKKRSDLRVEAIIDEINSLKQKLQINVNEPVIDSVSGNEEPDIKQQCSLDVQIYKMEFEGRAICKGADTGKHPNCKEFMTELKPWGEGSESCQEVRKKEKDTLKEGEKPYEEDLKMIKELEEKGDEAFIIEFAEDLESTKHVKLTEADEIIVEQEKILDGLKTKRDGIKNQIESLMDTIRKEAEEFASEYIEKATNHQKELEKANNVFESYLKRVEDGGRRMKRDATMKCVRNPMPVGPEECTYSATQEFKEDNLETTILNFLYQKNKLAGKEEAIWEGLDEVWKVSNVTEILAIIKKLGIPDKFPADATMEGIDTAKKLAEKVRDLMVVSATEILEKYIQEIDKAVADERIIAKSLIEKRMTELGVNEDNTPTEEQYKDLMDHKNYTEEGKITVGHKKLLQDLRTPDALSAYYNDLSDFFGIPEDTSIDNKFFVALPARSSNYVEKPECKIDEKGREEVGSDCNAGRDFRAPREPLLNLPPLREVFYFSTLDYEDMPQIKDIPTWTTFLNKKYVSGGWNDYPQNPKLDPDVEKWEYLPETWLYILARPNMRDDGKYQQTFEERSYGDGAIRDLLKRESSENDDNEYSKMIARAGVYPCQLGSLVIDVNPSVFDLFIIGRIFIGMQFVQGTVPNGITLPQCKEIALNNDESTPCGIYNGKLKGRKSGICHLLADHGMKNDDDEEIIDYQTSLPRTNSKIYEKHSELGNLLKFITNNWLSYRPAQKDIHEYLLDEDHSDNNITRQIVDRAAFTHNIFGSFLDAVNMEHNAKKMLDNTKKNLEEAILNLCQQVQAQGFTVIENGAEGEESEECDDNCQAQKCVETIMDIGLATSADEDTRYGTDGEYDRVDDYPPFTGISCGKGTSSDGSFYEELYCKLDEWKNILVDKSQNGEGAKTIKNERIYSDDNTETDVWVGFNNIASSQGEAVRDQDFDIDVEPDERVFERMQRIYNFNKALTTDKEETVFLSQTLGTLYMPESGEFDPEPAVVEKAVEEDMKTAKTNRTAERKSDEDAIRAQGNQYQVVPYCPLYMNNKKTGL